MKAKILTQFIDQFRAKHLRDPEQIVVTPLAMTLMALRRSIAPKWDNIPLCCREIELEEAVNDLDARTLGIALDTEASEPTLVAFDIE